MVVSTDTVLATIQPLATWIVGLVIYSVFTFKFYRFLGRERILALNLNRFNYADHPLFKMFFATLFWIIEFIIIFPVITFFWFFVLSALLAVLSGHPLQQTALLAMALVASVRITAYLSEDLSKDLAKMIPFALLGVLLVDIANIPLADRLLSLSTITTMGTTLAIYLGFMIVLELFLRLFSSFIHLGKE